MTTLREKQAVSSALWAAYGDALGFPTELVNEVRLEQRIGRSSVSETVAWTRLVGGKFGAYVPLPAGAYSDDTQLRLCTSRAIRGDGHFDVEAFSKIELPVWLCYALGAGRGSKVGAAALALRNTAWFGNFFEQKDTQYVNGGGNGAAMRVQPHVWAAANLSHADTYLVGVIRNTICTHGHPRAIAGAVIHAACLAYTMREQAILQPDEWTSLGDFIEISLDLIFSDVDLNTFWIPSWEQQTAKSLRGEMLRAKDEWAAHVEECRQFLSQPPDAAYGQIVSKLGGMQPDQRGSGLKCALFALVLAWTHRDSNPAIALRTSANLLSSDTDTISSMAGALVGALFHESAPPVRVQDAGYVEYEARRLTAVGEGRAAESFSYPDLLSWQAPRSQLDAVGLVDGKVALAGVGWIDPTSEEFSSGKSDVVWQWYETSFGQTVLCKRRSSLSSLAKSGYPAAASTMEAYVRPAHLTEMRKDTRSRSRPESRDLFHDDGQVESSREEIRERAGAASSSGRSIDEMSDEAIQSGFPPRLIGEHILALSERESGIELVVAYTAIIAKARRARVKRGRQ
ncbi:ADP-ribosylglycohydrolase family protein [Cupriavidus taiwanensis]|uniref:ADP-ribosylglycohydrolase family protein n=1 Tax=Cupriavidus taiwanensis TaxID=164546 RepID=UPI0025418E06|nr:ADP-ribosylglycohydrolase family protein [Cupriavidus taiwanensis]MDK3022830.1 ADP-ribosylglycohydrolase family protein [Cupriavidus taiwanensis]